MKIDKRWQTSTVVDLCQAMRQNNDYTTAPILADALEDSGCNLTELLEPMRSGTATRLELQRLVCYVIGGALAKAVKFMDGLVSKMGSTCTNYAQYEEQNKWMQKNPNKTRKDYYKYVDKFHQYENATYTLLMEAAEHWINTGEHTTQIGKEDWRDMFSREYVDAEFIDENTKGTPQRNSAGEVVDMYVENKLLTQFWDSYELIIGTKIPDEVMIQEGFIDMDDWKEPTRSNFFSCSC